MLDRFLLGKKLPKYSDQAYIPSSAPSKIKKVQFSIKENESKNRINEFLYGDGEIELRDFEHLDGVLRWAVWQETIRRRRKMSNQSIESPKSQEEFAEEKNCSKSELRTEKESDQVAQLTGKDTNVKEDKSDKSKENEDLIEDDSNISPKHTPERGDDESKNSQTSENSENIQKNDGESENIKEEIDDHPETHFPDHNLDQFATLNILNLCRHVYEGNENSLFFAYEGVKTKIFHKSRQNNQNNNENKVKSLVKFIKFLHEHVTSNPSNLITLLNYLETLNLSENLDLLNSFDEPQIALLHFLDGVIFYEEKIDSVHKTVLTQLKTDKKEKVAHYFIYFLHQKLIIEKKQEDEQSKEGKDISESQKETKSKAESDQEYFDFLILEQQMILAQEHMKETFLAEIAELKRVNEELKKKLEECRNGK